MINAAIENKTFSYEAEQQYYSKRWPTQALPYLHLEPYLRGWLDPEIIFSGKHILDVGAGECTYTRLIADRFKPERIVACELFRERLMPAFREVKCPHFKAVVGNCFSLPFQERSFDVVFASLMLCEMPNLKDVLGEFVRLLKPGGIFVGFEPNPFHPVILYRYFMKPRSTNHYLFWPKKILPIFKSAGLITQTKYFYARMPWVQSRFLGTCIGMIARKQA
jgi:ubiquinone/menaquinone biosynthesis C-methylase UbiE